MLEEANWDFGSNIKTEVPIMGVPSASGERAVDYVLYDADSLPLGVVEAKRTSIGQANEQQQAKLYANCLEREYGQHPVIFYTNGYPPYFWNDIQGGTARLVSDFYTPAELK